MGQPELLANTIMIDIPKESDDTRFCPTCRMPISVLATRCRHCGESVGRPRTEEKQFTVKDLGETTQSGYTVSGNVIDALESFRAEELSSLEAERSERENRRSWFARQSKKVDSSPPRKTPSKHGDLPELDATSRELADLIADPESSFSRSSPKPRPKPLIPTSIFYLGAVIAGLVVLYLTVDLGWARLQDYLESRQAGEEVVYVNRALDMLNAGQPPIVALEEAMEALRQVDNADNQAIAEEVRAAFVEQIEGLLAATPFNRNNLDRASSLAARAALADRSRTIQELQDRVEEETSAHQLVLTSIDREAGEATFRLHNPRYPQAEQTVGVGDRVMDRFLVQRISTANVQLLDEKTPTGRGFRTLNARLMNPVSGG